jgi:DNA mismatch endonuclease (patch repair protein)
MNRSENMRRIRSRDTSPEMKVRSLLHSLGYRYRLHRKDLPGKPDIVFPVLRKAIFVHGCFWHAHGCKMSHTPKSNEGYWGPKLARNVARDDAAQAQLAKQGWDSLVIWECKVKNTEELRVPLERFLNEPTSSGD